MKFVNLSEQEFRKFSLSQASGSFAQSVEFARLRNKLDWQTEFLGIKDSGEIKLAGLVAWKFNVKIPFGDFYLGPVFDSKDAKILTFFAEEIRKYAKQKGVIFVKISPTLIYQELTQAGDRSGKKNEKLMSEFERSGFNRGHNVIPHFVFKKNIAEFTNEKQLIESFKASARTNIRNASEKFHIQVRTLSRSELPLFKQIMEKTADRQGFDDKTLQYYENFYDIFTKSKDYTAEFVVAEFVVADLQLSYTKKKRELKRFMAESTTGAKKEYQNQIKGIERREKMLQELTDRPDHKIPISVGLYVKSKNETTYLFGGNDPMYLSFGGTYAHSWAKIKETLDSKIPIFNFYGVSGVFDRNDKSYGTLKYKQSFNGYIEELVGGFYLPVRPMKYFVAQSLRRIRKFKSGRMGIKFLSSNSKSSSSLKLTE